MEPAWIGNSDYYDECNDQPSWRDLQDRDKKLDTIEDFFKGILGELYGNNELDRRKLEWYLDEIAHQFEIKLPEKPLMLARPELFEG